MKKSLLTIGVATTLMIAWSIGRVQGQQSRGHQENTRRLCQKSRQLEPPLGHYTVPEW